MLVMEPIVLFLAVCNAFVFSIMPAFFPAFPYTFGTVYGFNTWQTGLAFLGIGVGVLLGVMTAMLCDKLVYQKLHKEALNQGKLTVPREHQLYAGTMGAVGKPIGFVLTGIGSDMRSNANTGQSSMVRLDSKARFSLDLFHCGQVN